MNDTSNATSGRVWLITGTSSGFGRAIAEAALAAGDSVVATARRPEVLDDLVAAHPDRVTAAALDVTEATDIERVVADTMLWHGRIDVLVNNAGRGIVGAVEETADAELRHLMELHFFGPAALTRAVLPHMRRQGSGAIVQISSMGGRVSFPAVSAYSATKFALEGLTESLAAEVARFGITAMIVEPGSFRTGFAGGDALIRSNPIEAYADTVAPFWANLLESDGNQPGDPAKAAEAILTALAADEVPLRLPLGNDAADMIAESLSREADEFRAWEKVTRGTDFDR